MLSGFNAMQMLISKFLLFAKGWKAETEGQRQMTCDSGYPGFGSKVIFYTGKKHTVETNEGHARKKKAVIY